MEGLLIALLVAALSSVFGGKNKAAQKKRPVRPANTGPITKRGGYDHKYSREIASDKPRKDTAVNYDMSYTNVEPVISKTKVDNAKYEEIDVHDEEILNIGLSDLQRAVVMTEVLGKPIALRKK